MFSLSSGPRSSALPLPFPILAGFLMGSSRIRSPLWSNPCSSSLPCSNFAESRLEALNSGPISGFRKFSCVLQLHHPSLSKIWSYPICVLHQKLPNFVILYQELKGFNMATASPSSPILRAISGKVGAKLSALIPFLQTHQSDPSSPPLLQDNFHRMLCSSTPPSVVFASIALIRRSNIFLFPFRNLLKNHWNHLALSLSCRDCGKQVYLGMTFSTQIYSDQEMKLLRFLSVI